ncbi:MAG TPA: hypothetical protein VFT90_03220, partial [Chryseosolibacter sp.]|nr:hypothetical protein [Chryseosolibacter sp.]
MHPPSEPMFLFTGVIILSSFLLLRNFSSVPFFRLLIFLVSVLIALVAIWLSPVGGTGTFGWVMLALSCGLGFWSARSWFVSNDMQALVISLPTTERFHLKSVERREMIVTRNQTRPLPDPSEGVLDRVKCAFFD